MKDKVTWHKLVSNVLTDPSAPFWVKSHLNTILDKDCVDAVKWMDILHDIAVKRMNDATGKAA